MALNHMNQRLIINPFNTNIKICYYLCSFNFLKYFTDFLSILEESIKTEIIVGKAIIPYERYIRLITNFNEEVDPTKISTK